VPYLVNITNRGETNLVGRVQLQSRPDAEDDAPHVFAERSFNVAPDSVEHLELPVHDAAVADLQLAAFDENGKPIAVVTAGTSAPSEPLLVDLTEPSIIGPKVAGRPLDTRFVPSSFVHYSVPALAVAKLERDLLDDRLLLPKWPTSYASATVVLLRSSQLMGLPTEQLKALAGWVLGGGSLAVVINRAEDLMAAALIGMVGGKVTDHPFDPKTAPPPANERLPRKGAPSKGPSKEVLEDLILYTGGNLRATQWGSAASYGLGEVHLLSFDPTLDHHAHDPWVQKQVLSLCSYAWDRTAHLVFPLGSTTFEDQVQSDLRDVLDPSQASLWSILVAGFLLVGYAAVAGPLNFYLARRSGNGVRALIRVPVLAAVTSACLVLLGMVSKGGSGHAHRLTLLELGAGVERGASVRYRSFFTDAELLSITPTTELGLLDVLGPRGQTPRSLEIGPRGAKIGSVHHRPWQTMFVREDGAMGLGKGVALLRDQSKIMLVNGTGYDLVAVLLHMPGGDVRFFPRIVRNQKVSSSEGDLVRVAAGGNPLIIHDLDLSDLKYRLERVAPGSAQAWLALNATSHRAVDWWPSDVPVLMAQVDAPAAARDANLPLKGDRLMLRVVGFGGTP